MAAIAYRVVRVLGWVSALGLAYLGWALLALGPMMGPRGDIDYVSFTDAAKRAADVRAFLTQCCGILPLAMAGVLVFYNERMAVAVAKRLTGRRS